MAFREIKAYFFVWININCPLSVTQHKFQSQEFLMKVPFSFKPSFVFDLDSLIGLISLKTMYQACGRPKLCHFPKRDPGIC